MLNNKQEDRVTWVQISQNTGTNHIAVILSFLYCEISIYELRW